MRNVLVLAGVGAIGWLWWRHRSRQAINLDGLGADSPKFNLVKIVHDMRVRLMSDLAKQYPPNIGGWKRVILHDKVMYQRGNVLVPYEALVQPKVLV